MEIKVEINKSFYDKTSPETYIQAMEESIRHITETTLDACKDESPVRTGNLRDGHYSKHTGLESYIMNSVDYAPYVIYGTSRQAPNPYTQRAVEKVNIEETILNIFQTQLTSQGLL